MCCALICWVLLSFASRGPSDVYCLLDEYAAAILLLLCCLLHGVVGVGDKCMFGHVWLMLAARAEGGWAMPC